MNELRRRLGITLRSTKGLLDETEFRKRSGLSQVGNYRRRGLITPVGFALNKAGVSPFYHPRQVKELKNKLADLKAAKKPKPRRGR